MQFETLGRTGVVVSRLCLGTMMFGHQGNADHDDSIRVIRHALDAGINFIDSADVYSYGESEELVGKAVAGRRDEVVIATKGHHPMSDDVLNRRGSTRSWLTRACEDSLRRLGTDYIDLYQVHRPDPLTDIDETLGVLSDLVRQGKVRMIGCCTFPPSEIVESHWVAEQRGHVKFRCNQPPYSIFTRGIEREVLTVCQRYGMGVITWSPLMGGWLAGRYRRGVMPPSSPRNSMPQNRVRDETESGFGKARPMYPIASFDETTPDNQRRLDIVERLEVIAQQAGMSFAQLSLGFVLAHPGVTSAIIGPRTMEQLVEQLPAGDLQLSVDVLNAIDAVVPPGSTTMEMGYVPRELTEPQRRRRQHR